MAKGKYSEWLEPDGLLLVEGWARDGLSDEQISHNMGIAYSTFRVWKDQFPAFSAALKNGKEVVDRIVENALFKRATGFEYDEISEKYENDTLTEKKITKKFIAPDTAAAFIWLKNRKPEVWRDKVEATDTTAIDKLDEILRETKKNASAQQETE